MSEDLPHHTDPDALQLRTRLLQEHADAVLEARDRHRRVCEEMLTREVRTMVIDGLSPRAAETGWTPEQPALLGTLPNVDLAARIGRSATAVRVKRTQLGIASACDRRRLENRDGGCAT